MSVMLRRAALLVALATFVSPLMGCEVREIMIRIPDFESKQVEGLWVWRFSEALGDYVRDGEIELTEPFVEGGVEQIEYVQRTIDGQPVFHLRAEVLRNPLDPDVVTLRILYRRDGAPTYFRASTFNPAGESPLTAERTFL